MSYNFGDLLFDGVIALIGIGVIVFRKQLTRASNDFYASRGWQFAVFDGKKSSLGGLIFGSALIVWAVWMAVSSMRR